jgi:hypothetical protein
MTAVLSGTNGLLQSYDYQAPTTGFSYTFAAGTQVLVLNPAGTLATGTITMPAAPVDGMTITFSSSQQITALTMAGNGATLVGAVNSLGAEQAVSYVYRATGTTWYPLGTQVAQATGPAFGAYLSADDTVSASVVTKVEFDIEQYDTNSRYNNTASTVGGIPAYAFLPNVAGYYCVTIALGGSASTTLNYAGSYLYINGVSTYRTLAAGYNATNAESNQTQLIYLNGTTDYVEFYAQISGSGTITVKSDLSRTHISAFLARAA